MSEGAFKILQAFLNPFIASLQSAGIKSLSFTDGVGIVIQMSNGEVIEINIETSMRQPDGRDDWPESIDMECKECGRVDEFDPDALNSEGEIEGFCEDCGVHQIFKKSRYL